MITLAEIVQHYGSSYEATYSRRLLPSHRRALQDIALCRTAALGGHLYHCDRCDEIHYQYHSCQNRHCPQCQHNQGQQWLEHQQKALLPVPYFMVTFTLPSALQEITRRHQKVVYNILFRSSATALQELAWDPRYVGGRIGMVGVLHTWGRQLNYHPHVHYLVPAGGLSADDEGWLSARHNFLIPVKALSILFRAKFRDALKETDLFDQVPAPVWQQDWVTHCKPVGKGEGALKYLAPTFSAWPSVTDAFSSWLTARSPFAIANPIPENGAPAHSLLRNFCVVFCNMCCPKALLKSAIMVSSVPAYAIC